MKQEKNFECFQSLKEASIFMKENREEVSKLIKEFSEQSYKMSRRRIEDVKNKYPYETCINNKKVFEFLLSKVGMPLRPDKK